MRFLLSENLRFGLQSGRKGLNLQRFFPVAPVDACHCQAYSVEKWE